VNKREFLSMIENRLRGIPQDDIDRVLEYYSEFIDDRMEDGLTEEEAVAAADPIDKIVEQTLKVVSLPKLMKEKARPKRALRTWETVLLIVGSPVWVPLLIAAFVIVLAVYIVIWSVVVALYAVDVALWASAVALSVCGSFYAFTGNFGAGILLIGAGMIVAGVALLMGCICKLVAKGMAKLSRLIMRGIKSCFLKKEKTV